MRLSIRFTYLVILIALMLAGLLQAEPVRAQNRPPSSTQSVRAQTSSNYALQLDGSDDRVVVPDAESLRPQAITIEAWVKESSFPNYASVMTKTSSSSWTDGFGLAHYNGDHDINFFVDEWDGHYVTGTLNGSGWTHVAGTYDGSVLRLYINGELAATQSNLPEDLLQPAPARVGADLRPRYDGEFEFAGRIDDMWLFDRTLTENEIQYLYERT